MSVISESRNVADRIVNTSGIRTTIVRVIVPRSIGFIVVNELRIGESYFPSRYGGYRVKGKQQQPSTARKGQGSKGQASTARLDELSQFYASAEAHGLEVSPFDRNDFPMVEVEILWCCAVLVATGDSKNMAIAR